MDIGITLLWRHVLKLQPPLEWWQCLTPYLSLALPCHCSRGYPINSSSFPPLLPGSCSGERRAFLQHIRSWGPGALSTSAAKTFWTDTPSARHSPPCRLAWSTHPAHTECSAAPEWGRRTLLERRSRRRRRGGEEGGKKGPMNIVNTGCRLLASALESSNPAQRRAGAKLNGSTPFTKVFRPSFPFIGRKPGEQGEGGPVDGGLIRWPWR